MVIRGCAKVYGDKVGCRNWPGQTLIGSSSQEPLLLPLAYAIGLRRYVHRCTPGGVLRYYILLWKRVSLTYALRQAVLCLALIAGHDFVGPPARKMSVTARFTYAHFRRASTREYGWRSVNLRKRSHGSNCEFNLARKSRMKIPMK